MMHPDKQEAYNYTLGDLETSLGCPQCRARQLLDAVSEYSDDYSRGQIRACLVVLIHDHKCGKE